MSCEARRHQISPQPAPPPSRIPLVMCLTTSFPFPRRTKRAEMVTVEGEHLPYPPHFRLVPIEIDLGAGEASATVMGSDLTAEYVHINADYRS